MDMKLVLARGPLTLFAEWRQCRSEELQRIAHAEAEKGAVDLNKFGPSDWADRIGNTSTLQVWNPFNCVLERVFDDYMHALSKMPDAYKGKKGFSCWPWRNRFYQAAWQRQKHLRAMHGGAW